MRTFGTLDYGEVKDWSGQTSTCFDMAVEAHVAIKAKRMFPRLRAATLGRHHLQATPDIAHDLVWFMLRYPLDVTPAARAVLDAEDARFEQINEQAAQILSGSIETEWPTEPAREPRPYQTQGAQLAWAVNRLLIADVVGLGKTMTSLLVLTDPDALPAMIVVPTHLQKQWAKAEIEATVPWLQVHVAKSRTSYDVEADILVVPYSKVQGWGDSMAGQIRTVIFDEVQELRKEGTQKYAAAKAVADRADRVIGLSATPIYNYGGEAHTIFNVIAPGMLGTRDEFVREWGGESRGTNVTVAKPNALGKYLQEMNLILRRTRVDVGRQIDKPSEVIVPVEHDTRAMRDVKAEIRAMAEAILGEETPARERFVLGGQMDYRLRQATGIAKAAYVARFVHFLMESEPDSGVVLYGWHRGVYDVWNRMLGRYNPVMYTGSESPAAKNESVRKFLDGESNLFVSSLRSGAGLDGLQRRSHSLVFGELDWSPEIHQQCIGRLARDGQEGEVTAYYLVASDGSDPIISGVHVDKIQQSEGIMQPDAPAFEMRDRSGEQRARKLAQWVLDQ